MRSTLPPSHLQYTGVGTQTMDLTVSTPVCVRTVSISGRTVLFSNAICRSRHAMTENGRDNRPFLDSFQTSTSYSLSTPFATAVIKKQRRKTKWRLTQCTYLRALSSSTLLTWRTVFGKSVLQVLPLDSYSAFLFRRGCSSPPGKHRPRPRDLRYDHLL